MREDWIEVELRDIAQMQDSLNKPMTGLVRGSQDQNDRGEGVTYIKMNNIDLNGNITLENTVCVNVTKQELDKYELKNLDILINTRNSFELVGKSAIIKSLNEQAVFNNNILRIRLTQQVMSEFISHQLISPSIRNLMRLGKKATTNICALYQKDILSLKLSLPPLPEQRAIVAKIEQLLSELDAGIESLKKAEAQLKTYRQAVLKKAFEGELTKGWRAQQSNLPTAEALLVQIKEERAQHYAQQLADWAQAVKTWEAKGKEGKKPVKPKKPKEVAPLSEEELKQLPNLPEGWGSFLMQFIADAIDPQPSHRTPPRDQDGIPYISIADINKNTGEINFDSARKVGKNVLSEHIRRYSIEGGDFVIGKIGTIGKPFFIPTERFFALSANVVLVKPLKRTVVPKFLFYLCVSSIIEKQFEKGSNATTQAAFGIKKVRLLVTPLCSLSEQHQIVQEIESRLSVCDQVEASIQTGLAKAEALRQSILKKAFEGRLLSEAELATCKNEKDWAPASTLLAQIEAEKAEAAAKAPKKASRGTKKKKSVK